ncbi:MAG TPA: response regulator [Tepidisphaeraceae bacterium]|nr:response regulator [Tepidisphaeraceae bacterium]
MSVAFDPSRFTVLLADANDPWRNIVDGLLTPMGVKTVSVRTGRDALSMIEQKQVHVAVLDVDMPGMGGMQVVKRMQQLNAAPPAILLARQVSAQLMHEALGMRVFSVLGKPVDFNLLLDSLARVMRRHYEGRWPA